MTQQAEKTYAYYDDGPDWRVPQPMRGEKSLAEQRALIEQQVERAEYEAEHPERQRQGAQTRRALRVMQDGKWHDVGELRAAIDAPHASAVVNGFKRLGLDIDKQRIPGAHGAANMYRLTAMAPETRNGNGSQEQLAVDVEEVEPAHRTMLDFDRLKERLEETGVMRVVGRSKSGEDALPFEEEVRVAFNGTVGAVYMALEVLMDVMTEPGHPQDYIGGFVSDIRIHIGRLDVGKDEE